MSPPFADLSAALPQAPWSLTALAPATLDDYLSPSPLYSTCVTGTAPARHRGNLTAKRCSLFAASLVVIALGLFDGYAFPPTPETSDYKQTRSKPGGFLQGPFQVEAAALKLSGFSDADQFETAFSAGKV